jgi:hypothetical protein
MTKAMTDDQFAALLAELRGIRAAVERPPASFDRQGELLSAVEDHFGRGCPFTTCGILTICDDEPHGPMAVAVARLIDLAAPGRAVALGKLLSSIDALERARRAGVLLYRLGADD